MFQKLNRYSGTEAVSGPENETSRPQTSNMDSSPLIVPFNALKRFWTSFHVLIHFCTNKSPVP